MGFAVMESGGVPPRVTRRASRLTGPSGATLLYVILSLLLLSALAAAISCLSPGAGQAPLTENRHARAYYLALSGLNAWSVGKVGTYRLGEGRVTLAETGPDATGLYTVTSRGTVLAGTGGEANVVLTARRSGLAPITFTNDLKSFPQPTVNATANSDQAVSVYAANTGYAVTTTTTTGHGGSRQTVTTTTNVTAPYASGSLVFAKDTANTNGAVWYVGSRGTCAGGVCPDGMCTAGACGFGKGLRAFFGFIFARVDNRPDSTAFGDGFTFTVASAATNTTATAAGGPTSDSRGEYLGYAGPGPSGVGIAAPKLAVEVDIYPNKGTNPPEMVDSRHDNANANHVALVWWGNDGLYDDNVHGNGFNLQYSTTDVSQIGYCQVAKSSSAPNWLEDAAEHTLRLEIHRDAASAGGTYQVKVWIDGTGSGIDDVTRDYTAETPQLLTTTTLNAAEHAGLDSILFGWTEATGQATQTVAIHDFSLEFRH